MSQSTATKHVDAVVIGAGFAGLYMYKKLRDDLGMTAQVYERGDGVGGTWYWNRYPGARCDSESYVYCFSFDEDLLQEWSWSGKYPEQPEILEYLNHVADRFDLRSGIQFNTSVTAAHFDDDSGMWTVETDQGDRVTSKYVITAIGCISTGQIPNIPGLDSFEGEWHHTGAWPHEGVEFEGKRVAVIGTGSSGVQSIPVIARESEHLTVFQRTPQYTIPAQHGTVDQAFLKEVKANYAEIMQQAKTSAAGFPYDASEVSALEVSDEERLKTYEELWQKGGFHFMLGSYSDIALDRRANDTASEFIRGKIREIVDDPETAEKLLPRDHPFASKRALIDTNYFETYNRDNVDLVDIRHFPIEEITSTGLRTSDGQEYEVDVIVFATGYDAMTGTFLKMDIRGSNGAQLRDKWSDGPRTYLGLAAASFPNMFMITGPGSPSVLSNMPVSIEQHVEWISDFIEYLREHDVDVVDAEQQAEDEWVDHVNEIAEQTMYMLADSWYLGANIPGKPRVFMPYAGGVNVYRERCNEIAAEGYTGFTMSESREPALTD
ncbi:MAG: NAD(P)/FAD-dependent oxidoreductase [Chloroflexi bacterium]|nr:NAD(P)/FAD-dependent oxidoreductase [Chloroflexota bacterium]MCY3696595.1 NAD(P)/FAD-dependent oxidoreductase [Chloroflexota bacterium]MXX31103.1 NAD(P)/FAD-dependent oxidoreductase [Chloroflexota bacterium]MXX81629.1 NAD(P)/FAD-dependent oxidoreductase [Chloroflexota bacterium]MYB21389.1 NAD(P)/FAD-dependent oxidoreductase [Chloroflexota bacterium]